MHTFAKVYLLRQECYKQKAEEKICAGGGWGDKPSAEVSRSALAALSSSALSEGKYAAPFAAGDSCQ